MRFYEWLSVIFSAAFALLAWTRKLSGRRRAPVTGIAIAGIAGILRLRSTAARDWLPVVVIPLASWSTVSFPATACGQLEFIRPPLREYPSKYIPHRARCRESRRRTCTSVPHHSGRNRFFGLVHRSRRRRFLGPLSLRPGCVIGSVDGGRVILDDGTRDL